MKDDNEEVKQLRAKVEFLERQLAYQQRTIAVLVAVGALKQSKLEQAQEIVSGLSD
jgi:uncharacterized coiled-coil protein SlyX